ncbi:MAG: PilN domain-containing protein [Sulfuritalea sp.]|nr:PilN domain-containing protein [Sulfuritalea sp.]
MSAQINLYHPRFLKQRELLVLGKVVLAAGALYIVLAVVGGWAWRDAAARKDAAAAAEAQLLSVKEQVDAATKAAAESKPDAQLIAELGNAEALLRRRGDIARLLESGAIGSAGGFSDYLRGFARQKPDSLWLTGFTIGAGGNDMEIRGSMLNPAALPDYIRRLGTEKVFQGRNFAALTMNRAEPAPTPPTTTTQVVGAATGPAPTPVLRPIDFILMPKLVEAKEAGS